MNVSRTCQVGFVIAVWIGSAAAPAATPLGTAFTYQGRLKSAGQPFNGSANLVFKLYDASSAGNLLGT
ncbi:MAG TPA: hypothetical protein PLC79_02705, partial [Phycisphaerae bacterium]|nr:hypothetical protein [Phycisphaerae bacterium]